MLSLKSPTFSPPSEPDFFWQRFDGDSETLTLTIVFNVVVSACGCGLGFWVRFLLPQLALSGFGRLCYTYLGNPVGYSVRPFRRALTWRATLSLVARRSEDFFLGDCRFWWFSTFPRSIVFSLKSPTFSPSQRDFFWQRFDDDSEALTLTIVFNVVVSACGCGLGFWVRFLLPQLALSSFGLSAPRWLTSEIGFIIWIGPSRGCYSHFVLFCWLLLV